MTDFEEFYESAYARLVGQLFSVTGSLEQAEDVVQEAFIRALDRWPRIQGYDVPELWVRRVAINLAVSELRRLRRRAAALLRLGAQRPLPPLTPQTVEVAELLRRVPVNQRPVLLLHDVLDLPLDQVAEQLGLPESTVRGRLARARANLRRRARRRRTIREVATVTAVAAAVLAAFPLVAWERSGTTTPGPTAPHTPRPKVTDPARPLLASPSETVPGGTITLTGTGCAPGKAVTFGIRWDRGAKMNPSMEEQKQSPGQPQPTATAAGTYELPSVAALASGSFETRVKIPADLTVNRPTLWVSCATSAPSHPLTRYVSIVVRNPY